MSKLIIPEINGISAGTSSVGYGNVVFSNSNNVSFGLNGSIVTASAAGGGAADGVNILAAGTQTANTTGTVAFVNSNGISFGMSNSSQITASYTVPSVPAQSQQPAILSISGGTTRITNNEAIFSNANGISFGVNGQTITASHNGLTSQSNQAASAANGSFAFQTVLFSNANGISFGTSAGSAISASHNGLTSQSNQALSGSNGSFTFQTASLGNLNGLSFYTSNGSMVGSYTVPTVTNSSWTVSDAASSASVARLAFTNLNGVTLSLSTGANGSHTIVGSHNALTSQSNQAFSASGGSSAFQTLNFANSNGFTFSNSNGSVIASYTVPSVPAQTAQTLGFYAVSNTTGQSSSSTFDARTLSFHGAGIASVGASGGSIVISVPAGGGAGDGVNILAAGTQTANTTGTVLFSNSNGVTFGMNNSSVITASVNAGGAADTLSYYNPTPHANASVQTIGNATMNFRNIVIYQPVSFDRFVHQIYYSNASNSTITVSATMSIALFTRNGASLSLLSSASSSLSINGSGSGNASLYNNIRNWTIGFSGSVNTGSYWLGIWSRSSTAGANGTLSNVVINLVNSAYSGIFGVSSASSLQMTLGNGSYNTSFSTAMPSSFAISDIHDRGVAAAHYMPAFYLTNGTL